MPSSAPRKSDLPEARVVRPGERRWQPTAVPVRDRLDAAVEPVKPRLHAALAVIVGLWPLIAVALLAGAFLWSAGHQEPTF